MSEFRFYTYSDSEYASDHSQYLISLPISRFQPTRRTTTDEVSHELNVPYTVFEILVAIFAVVGNLMVIVVFQRERKLRRRTNYYIVSLAVADFLVGSLGVPFAILASIGLPTNLYACLFTVSLLVVLCTISIFCLVAVSVDRYWAILYPMAYSRNVRTKTAIVIISLCWLAGTVVGFLPLFGWHAEVAENQACLFVEVMDYNYLVFLYFATIITPALLMLAFYAHIYRVIVKQVRQIVTMNPVGDSSRRSSTSQIQITTPSRPCHGGTMLRVLGAARKRDVKATQNLSIIVLFFMICWIPLYTINCIKAFWPDYFIHEKLTLFCIILSHLNSAVNPVLYAYHLKDFRAALKNLILKIIGIDIEQPPEGVHRFSLASQHRLQSMDVTGRHHLHPKIYIDSPIWLRQQQQLALRNPPLVSPCLNNITQTVTAVASVPGDLGRELWNGKESPRGAETIGVRFELPSADKDLNGSTTTLNSKRQNSEEQCDSKGSDSLCESRNYSTTPEEPDYDEVFLPSGAKRSSLNRLELEHSMRLKLYSDSDHNYSQRRTDSDRHHPLTDSSSSYYEMPKQSSSTTSSPRHSPQVSNYGAAQAQDAYFAVSTNSRPMSDGSSNGCLANANAIYVIQNEMNPLSPGHRPKFKRPQRFFLSPSSIKASKSLSRSCSCTTEAPSSPATTLKDARDGDLIGSNSSLNATNSVGGVSSRGAAINNNLHNTNNLNYYTFHHTQHTSQHFTTEKFSPLRAVSNLIFPPIVKHSSVFQLFHPNSPNEDTSTKVPTAASTPTTISATRPDAIFANNTPMSTSGALTADATVEKSPIVAVASTES